MDKYDQILETMIIEKSKYDPITRVNEDQYLQFKDEIESHLAGELAWDQLSLCAQDTIREWEWILEGELEAEGYWEKDAEL